MKRTLAALRILPAIVAGAMLAGCPDLVSHLEQVDTPAFNPPGGLYATDQNVKITVGTEGATIHYTIDGSDPTRSSPTFTAALAIRGNGTGVTVKAMATRQGMRDSATAEAAYGISYPQVSTPVFSPPPGIYFGDLNVAIASSTGEAVIHYTTDGTTPTTSSPTCTAPLAVTGPLTTTTIAAIADKPGMTVSDVARATYMIADWTAYGSPGSGPGQFGASSPIEIAIDASGRIYIADFGNNRIVRMDDMNGTNWAAFGSTGSGIGEFNRPTNLCLDGAGRLYVVDRLNDRIVRFDDMSGTNWVSFGSHGAGTGQFNAPSGIVAAPGGAIHIVDTCNYRIVRMDDMSGGNWTTFGTRGSGASQFEFPVGIAMDTHGRLYVADRDNCRIARFDDMGGDNWITFGGYGCGTSQFASPLGVAIDSSGRLYIADTGNHRIARFDDMGGTNWITFGSFGGGAGQFNVPFRSVVDARFRVLVADGYNNRIVRVTLP